MGRGCLVSARLHSNGSGRLAGPRAIIKVASTRGALATRDLRVGAGERQDVVTRKGVVVRVGALRSVEGVVSRPGEVRRRFGAVWR